MAAPTRQTLLAIGAHYDDCVFGLPGILIQAAHQNHRVVILSLIGDYDNWPPGQGRGAELKETCAALAHAHGIETRFLGLASGRFQLNDAHVRAVSEVVAEVRPDVGFMLWPHDRHPDHEAAAAISKAALRLASRVLGDGGVKVPSRVYLYDNGPGHTIGFEPDTYVDISEQWPYAVEWLGQLMAFVRQVPYEAGAADAAVSAKANLARYRGGACGARYAEAVRALTPRPTRIT